MTGFGIGRRAEIEPAGRNAADDARFGRQGDVVEDLLFIGDVGDPFRHADAQVDHAVGPQFQGRPAGDDFAVAHLHGRQWTASGTLISLLKAGL